MPTSRISIGSGQEAPAKPVGDALPPSSAGEAQAYLFWQEEKRTGSNPCEQTAPSLIQAAGFPMDTQGFPPTSSDSAPRAIGEGREILGHQPLRHPNQQEPQTQHPLTSQDIQGRPQGLSMQAPERPQISPSLTQRIHSAPRNPQHTAGRQRSQDLGLSTPVGAWF